MADFTALRKHLAEWDGTLPETPPRTPEEELLDEVWRSPRDGDGDE